LGDIQPAALVHGGALAGSTSSRAGTAPREKEASMAMEKPGAQAQDTRRLGAGAIASLGGVGLLLVFMLQNREDVSIDFLFWTFTWPLWLYSLVLALVGALVWFGLGVLRRHRRRKERREDRRD
jgi:uncharacterized integral membrane protein